MRTEPAAVGLNSSAGQLLGLVLVVQNLAFPVALGPRVVHLEPAHSGGAPGVTFPIFAIRVEGVLRLTRHVRVLLFLLRHLFTNTTNCFGLTAKPKPQTSVLYSPRRFDRPEGQNPRERGFQKQGLTKTTTSRV